MARPTTIKQQNKLEIDTLEYIKTMNCELKEYIDSRHNYSMHFKQEFKQETHEWRIDLNIKIDAQNLVLKRQDEILASFKEILAKQDAKLMHLEKVQDEIKTTLKTHGTEIQNLKDSLNLMGRYTIFQLFTGIAGLVAFCTTAWGFFKGFVK